MNYLQREALESLTSADLLEELNRRGDIEVAQTTHTISGMQFANRLGEGDELRLQATRMAQLMLGRFIADATEVQHTTSRKLKTSADEEIRVSAVLVRTDAVRAWLLPPRAEEETTSAR